MNERIYTLAEQVGATRWSDELNGNSIDFSPEQLEKFAELIVMECADIAKKEQEYNDSHSIHVNIDYCIKHHFGVE